MTTTAADLARQSGRGIFGVNTEKKYKFKPYAAKKKKFKNKNLSRLRGLFGNPGMRGMLQSNPALMQLLQQNQQSGGVTRPPTSGGGQPPPPTRPMGASSGVSVAPTAPVSQADLQRMSHEQKQQSERERAMREDARDEKQHRRNMELREMEHRLRLDERALDRQEHESEREYQDRMAKVNAALQKHQFDTTTGIQKDQFEAGKEERQSEAERQAELERIRLEHERQMKEIEQAHEQQLTTEKMAHERDVAAEQAKTDITKDMEATSRSLVGQIGALTGGGNVASQLTGIMSAAQLLAARAGKDNIAPEFQAATQKLTDLLSRDVVSSDHEYDLAKTAANNNTQAYIQTMKPQMEAIAKQVASENTIDNAVKDRVNQLNESVRNIEEGSSYDDTELREKIESMKSQMDSLASANVSDDLRSKVDALQNQLNEKIVPSDEELQNRIMHQIQNNDTLSSNFSRLDNGQQEIQKILEDTQGRGLTHDERIREIDDRLTHIIDNVPSYHKVQEAFGAHTDQINNLRQHLEDLETRAVDGEQLQNALNQYAADMNQMATNIQSTFDVASDAVTDLRSQQQSTTENTSRAISDILQNQVTGAKATDENIDYLVNLVANRLREGGMSTQQPEQIAPSTNDLEAPPQTQQIDETARHVPNIPGVVPFKPTTQQSVEEPTESLDDYDDEILHSD